MPTQEVQTAEASSLVTFTGEGYVLHESKSVQLIKARSLNDKFPYKIVSRKDDRLLAQYTYRLEALTQWERFYAR